MHWSVLRSASVRQQGEVYTECWSYKAYVYGPTDAAALHGAVADAVPRLSELRAAVSEQSVLGTVVLRLSRNLFEASTGGHEWGAGFCLAELLLSRPQLVRGTARSSPVSANISALASALRRYH